MEQNPKSLAPSDDLVVYWQALDPYEEIHFIFTMCK
jgi:hypothetical protein